MRRQDHSSGAGNCDGTTVQDEEHTWHLASVTQASGHAALSVVAAVAACTLSNGRPISISTCKATL